jgi:hypothetical protein
MKFLNYCIVLYTLVLLLVFLSKPPLFFDNNGNLKNFGIKQEETLFSFGVFVVTIVIVIVFTFGFLEFLYAK